MAAYANESFIAENGKYLLAALALHIALGAALTVTMNARPQTVIPSQLAIKAVVIDNSAQRLKREREQALAEQMLAEQRAREQQEAERLLAEQKAREQEQAQAELKRQEDERRRAAEQQRKTDQARAARQAEQKRLADIKTRQEEKQRAEREARDQAAREAELKRQLADEEGRMQAENSGLLNQYAALIEQRVVRNWNKPASARAGIQCDVKVTQAPGGTVLSVQIDKCNGDAAVRQSIEAAVHRSSPLPPPPDARLFQRVIVFVFKPSE